jgi:hypothetical protein
VKNYFLIIISLFFLSGTPEQDKTAVGFSNDFKILVQSLRELDPMLYKVMDKETFDVKVKAIDERLAHTSSKNEATYIIQEFMYELGDSHAGVVSCYGDLGVDLILPFKVFVLKDSLYIRNYDVDTAYNGAKIYSIDHVDSKAIIDSLKIFYPNDGKRNIVGFGLQAMFNSFYGAFCDQRDTFRISTSKGELIAPAVKRGDKNYKKLVSNSWRSYTGVDKFFKSEITNDYGYFRFSSFDKKVEGHEIESELDQLIKKLNEKKISNLIIDLRYNEGGDGYMAGRMASHFSTNTFAEFAKLILTPVKKPTYVEEMAKRFSFRFRLMGTEKTEDGLEKVRFDKGLKNYRPTKEKFNGEIYIITGSITVSSATMFCSYLLGQENVVFVGSETDGAINYFCAHKHCELTLPKSGLMVDFGRELIELKKGSSKNEKPKGIIPEHYIEYNIQDVISGKDKEMDWIKNDIKK